jgi:GTPase SAR1 family protein
VPPATYDDLVARVRGLVPTSGTRPVVGISGHGGAGKSTLAARLAVDLGQHQDQVVGTDAFHATTCGPDAGLWEQHDWAAIGRVVRSARALPSPARLTYAYRWWGGETGVEDHPMPPVLLVEGIRLFSDRTRDWFDLRVWIDASPEAAGSRAKARNLSQGDDQAELDLWDTKWIPEGHEYEVTARPRDRADLVLGRQGPLPAS